MHQLKVIDIHKTIPEASVISFEIPDELKTTFQFKPGQFLTLQFQLNGETVRRSYSICSAATDDDLLQVGVKRVEGGLVSNHINDELKVGDLVDVLPPDGRFSTELDPKNYKTYYLFAAGSGVTPILSILKSVLKTEERSFVNLLYGNRDQQRIMFKAELDELQEKYADRLVVVHTLSAPKQKWSDLWTENEEYITGRVNAESIAWMLNTYPPYAQNTGYFICGPGKMIDNTKQVLRGMDVPENRIFSENFGGNAAATIVEGVESARLAATLNGSTVNTTVTKDQTILRALVAAGAEPPYSCEGGVCSTCKCKLTKGKVQMKINLALTEEEVAAGYVLSCQSIPLTKEVSVVY